MDSKFVVALLVAVPVIVFPAAVVWYFNVGGIWSAVIAALSHQKKGKKQARSV